MQSFGIVDDQMVEAWRRFSHTMAYGLLLRGTPYHFKHDKTYFPKDVCEEFGLLPIKACDLNSDAVRNVVKHLTDAALQNYKEAAAIWKDGSKGENKIFEDMVLLTTPSVFYLEQLRKRDYYILNKSLSSPFMNVKLQNRLLVQKKLHRYCDCLLKERCPYFKLTRFFLL